MVFGVLAGLAMSPVCFRDLEFFMKLASRASVLCCFDISTVWLGRLRDILCFVDFHVN